MWLYVIVGVVIVIVIILILYCRYYKNENYSPRDPALIETLVEKIAPKVKGTNFTKDSIRRMIGEKNGYDAEMHYRFKTMVNDGNISKEKLTESFN